MENIDIALLLTIVGAITALTNVIVQVLKKITWDKIPTNILAVLVSMALTLAAGAAYAQIKNITITWYLVVAAVVVGFLCAYAAMFGFDKLKEIMNWGDKNDGD